MRWRRRRFERRLDSELQFHLEQQVRDYVNAGLTEEEARRKARLLFGGLDQVREECRDVRGIAIFETLLQDVRFAFRTFRKSRAFTVTAVLSIALGIGANTAIFSLMDALFWRSLPVRAPHELVQLTRRLEGQPPNVNFSYQLARQLAEQEGIFAGVFAFSAANVFNVGPADNVQHIVGAWVSGDYHATLGLTPVVGRLLTRADDEPGALPAVVITDGFWDRAFARSPAIIGQPILIEGHPVTIVGVTAPGFTGTTVGEAPDLTLPVAAMSQVAPERAQYLIDGGVGTSWMRVLARPKDTASPSQFKAQLDVVWSQLMTEAAAKMPGNIGPETRRLFDSKVEIVAGGTGYTPLRRQYRQPLGVLATIVGLVLLIACTNVANLLLARGTAREREMAMRLAIGAGRGRLVRQLLTESMLLASMGATLGLFVAWFGGTFIVQLLSSSMPAGLVLDLTPNWRVLLFTSAAAIGTGVVFGIVPALCTTAAGPSAALKQTTRSSGSRARLIPSLVTLQVALSLVLLIGAGLFIRTLQNLRTLDPGFRSEGVLLAEADGQRLGYRGERLRTFYKEVLQRLEELPGVVSASLSAGTPLGDTDFGMEVTVKGRSAQKAEVSSNAVSSNYFETMQIPILFGRNFDVRDDTAAAQVAIVSEAFVRRLIPEGDPLGQRIISGRHEYEIVGVVRDTIARSLRQTPPSTIYRPYFQDSPIAAAFEVRAAGSLRQVASAIHAELQSRLPGTAVTVRALASDVEKSLVQERLMSSLATGFGVLALVLASVGLYGSLAYAVTRRTREIGIRIAVGAMRGDVAWMILRHALSFVLIGVALGIPAALALAGLVSNQISVLLFGLKPSDPTTIAAAAGLLIMVAAFAAYIPARRASTVDPMVTLRHE